MANIKSKSSAEVITEALTQHSDELRAFVVKRVGALEADDVLQNAAIKAFEKSYSLQDKDSVLPWLYQIHRNSSIDALRKLAHKERLFQGIQDDFDVQSPDDKDDNCNCSIQQALSLKPDYASILSMVDVGNVSLSEAANLLNISKNNATVRLHRAREALKSAMRSHCGVTSYNECADCKCVYEGCCSSSST